MRSIAFCAYAAGIVAWTTAAKPSITNISALLFSLPESASGAPWLIFWLIGTAGPLVLSALAWVFARKTDSQWAPHLMFIPAAILVFWGGIRAFMATAGTPIEDMKEADAVMLGFGYLLLALFVHIVALARATLAVVREALVSGSARRSR